MLIGCFLTLSISLVASAADMSGEQFGPQTGADRGAQQPQRPIMQQPERPIAPSMPQPQRPIMQQPDRPVAPPMQRPAPMQPDRPVASPVQRPAPMQPDRPVAPPQMGQDHGGDNRGGFQGDNRGGNWGGDRGDNRGDNRGDQGGFRDGDRGDNRGGDMQRPPIEPYRPIEPIQPIYPSYPVPVAPVYPQPIPVYPQPAPVAPSYALNVGDSALVNTNSSDACNGTVVQITAIYANGSIAVQNSQCNGFEGASALSKSLPYVDGFSVGDTALVLTNSNDACNGSVVSITALFANGTAQVQNSQCNGFEGVASLERRIQ